jgi:hypothetical protein
MTNLAVSTSPPRRTLARVALACALASTSLACTALGSGPGVALPAAARAFAAPSDMPSDAPLLASLDTDMLARDHFELRGDFEDAPAKGRPRPEPPADVAPTPAPTPPPNEPPPTSVTPKHGRQIIYTASLGIGVYDLAKAMVAAEELPARHGGWIHMRTEGQVVMRLPAEHLRPAMDELGKLGIVQSRTLQSEDVTTEYVDLDARIKVLQDTQAQLLALLDKAKTVEEALYVRKALDDVTLELEAALGRQRQLTNLIAFSTLTVYLYELGPTQPLPSSNDPFPWVDELGVETTEWR